MTKQKKLRHLEYYDLQERFDELFAKSKQGELFTNMLAKSHMNGRSVEYMDNRVSLYAAQYGKCAVTGKVLWIDEIHCHHKKPASQGGTDKYKNLIIVHIDVHRLIHATKPETITAYLNKLHLTKPQLEKLNKLRTMAGNPAI